MNKNTLIILGICILAIVVASFFYTPQEPQAPLDEVASNEIDQAIRNHVVAFGNKLKNVPLLATSTDARQELEAHYADFLTPELLAIWSIDPSKALGRSVSSPWPDRIEIVSVTKDGTEGYKVEGNVIEVTSADKPNEPAAVYPVSLTIVKQGDSWRISKVEKGMYAEMPKRVSVTGVSECLPHKNTSGPQTMECALGIKEDQTGKHYALNFQLMSMQPVDYPTGSHLKVDGVLTPIEQLSTDMWQKYNVVGILSATTVTEL